MANRSGNATSTTTTTTTNAPSTIPQFKLSSQNIQDLQNTSDLLHLLHHRNHSQHRRSLWYRHFNTFRRHLATLLHHLSILAEQPTTHLGKHRKKATDAKVHAQIQAELAFWRDVLVPKWQHAFAQVTADGRFAVLGVVLLAALAQVGRIVGLVGVYENMGEEEVRRVLERFAKETWGAGDVESGGDEGVRIEREGTDDEDFGEILRREVSPDEKVEELIHEDARATEREVRSGASSACMAPEQDVLRQSRDALRQASESPERVKSSRSSPMPISTKKLKVGSAAVLADSKPEKKRPAKEKLLTVSKPPKKKKKKNAIDDLFSGL